MYQAETGEDEHHVVAKVQWHEGEWPGLAFVSTTMRYYARVGAEDELRA